MFHNSRICIAFEIITCAVIALNLSALYSDAAESLQRQDMISTVAKGIIPVPDSMLPVLSVAPRGVAVIDTINVEVDFMQGAGHIHTLHQWDIDVLTQMFACHGIVLNIEISDTIPEVDSVNIADLVQIYQPTYSNHYNQRGWHYCLVVHRINGGFLGGATMLGSAFMVVSGEFPPDTWSRRRQRLFVHELGHNLGLTHAGAQDESIVGKYKPNYPSVMSYRYLYAADGIRSYFVQNSYADSCVPLKQLDYSNGLLPALDENALDESVGVGFLPIDWNCNGVIDVLPVTQDVSDSSSGPTLGCHQSPTATYDTLTDYDDWSNLVDMTYAANGARLGQMPTVSCMLDESALMSQTASYRVAQVVVDSGSIEQCISPICNRCSQNQGACCCDTPGDSNSDGAFNISDITFNIARIFSGGPAPLCQDAADSNGDNSFNIADVTFGIARIFSGGPAPVCGTTGI